MDELINDQQFTSQLHPDTFAYVIATYLAFFKHGSPRRGDIGGADHQLIGIRSASDRAEMLKELRSGFLCNSDDVLQLGELKRIECTVCCLRWVVDNVGAVIANYNDASDCGSYSTEGSAGSCLSVPDDSVLISARSSPTPRRTKLRPQGRRCKSARESPSNPLLCDEQIVVVAVDDNTLTILRIENFPQSTVGTYAISHDDIDRLTNAHVPIFDVIKCRSAAATTSVGQKRGGGCTIS